MKLFSKTTRQRLEAQAAKAVMALFAALPVDAASGLGGGIARTIGPLLGVSNVARRNLARAFPDKSPAEIETIVRDAWENLGRVAAEFPHINTLAAERVEVVGMEYLHQLRDDGKPGLFVSGHIGNWELGAAISVREGVPITLVYREANNPWVEDLYRRYRATAATGQIRKGAEGAREMMAVLRGNGHICLLVDQKMNDGIPVPFFGRDAMTAPAVARFALKYQCPVVPVCIERLNGARFRMTFQPPVPLPASGDIHADTQTLMRDITRHLEDWIRRRPGQWLWMHKRWPE